MWSIAEAKVSKELKPFDGSHSKYEIWANRIKDHFKKKYSDWEYLFDEVEAQKVPISKDRLVSSYLNADGYSFDIDVAYCSNSLWTFIGEHVVDTMYNNRSVLAGGSNNGLELWRARFVKHKGGADQVQLGGVNKLHNVPQCDRVDALQFCVGK